MAATPTRESAEVTCGEVGRELREGADARMEAFSWQLHASQAFEDRAPFGTVATHASQQATFFPGMYLRGAGIVCIKDCLADYSKVLQDTPFVVHTAASKA